MSYDSDIVVRSSKVSRTYNVYRGASPSSQSRLEGKSTKYEVRSSIYDYQESPQKMHS